MSLVRRFAVLLLGFSILATACGQNTSGVNTPVSTGPKELVIGQAQDVSNFDATQIQDQPGDSVILNVLEPLFRRGPDYKMTNVLAASVENNADKTVWTVKLIPNVKFENGSPMDANAVKFTIDSILDPNRKPASITKAKIDYVKSVDVVDPLTVRFNLKTPNNFFVETIATVRVVDPVYYKANTTAFVSKNLNGTGPFKVQSYTPGESIVLVPSPTWRGKKPGLDKLTYKFILDASARVAAIQTGAVDIIRNATLDQLDLLKKDKALTVTTVDQERAIFIGINQTKGFPFTDIRFRQALNHAVDVDTIIKTVLRGYAKRIPTILSSKTTGYNGEIKPWQYDVAKAKSLISQVGLPAGFKVTYMVTTGNHPQDDQVGQAVADYIRAAGVPVDLKVYPSTEFLNIKNASQLTDLWMIGWASGSFEGYDDMSWIARTKATLWGDQLMTDPVSDGFMQQAAASLDLTQRNRLLGQVQQRFYDQANGIFMYSTVNNYVSRDRVVNWTPPVDDNVSVQVETTVK